MTLCEPLGDFLFNSKRPASISAQHFESRVSRMTTFPIGKDQSVRSIRNWDDPCFMKRSSKFYERNREDLSLVLTTTYERTGWLRNSTVSSEGRWTFQASIWPIFNIPNQQGFSRFSHKTLIKSLGTSITVEKFIYKPFPNRFIITENLWKAHREKRET